jgi:hypothetical protein
MPYKGAPRGDQKIKHRYTIAVPRLPRLSWGQGVDSGYVSLAFGHQRLSNPGVIDIGPSFDRPCKQRVWRGWRHSVVWGTGGEGLRKGRWLGDRGSLKGTSVPSALPPRDFSIDVIYVSDLLGETSFLLIYFLVLAMGRGKDEELLCSFIDRKREESFTCLLVEDEQ